ncbi:MAG: SMP-30/gluconolactonase/LRE family protein [Minwuia sp.]|nr:SMP-30/gluconolactonase/LRE family protein [Minwuia sp.]
MSRTDQHLGIVGAARLAALVLFTALMAAILPAMTAEAADCREVHLTDASTGAVLRGIEDLVWHAPSKRILLSAHDRWADDDDDEPVANGIYAISFPRLKREFIEVSRPIDLPVPNLTELFQESSVLHPHGFTLWEPDLPKAGFLDQRIGKQTGRLMVINHREMGVARRADGTAGTSIEVFFVAPNGELDHESTYSHPDICAANDLDVLDEDTAIVSLDRGACGGIRAFLELLLGQSRSKIARVDVTRADGPEILDDGMAFANGIHISKGEKPTVYVAETQANRIRAYDLVDGRLKRPARTIPVPGGPDNLDVDAAGNLLAAVHPDTMDLYFYMRKWPFFSSAPTRLIAMDTDKPDGCTVLHDDPEGDPISGATGVLRIDGMLVAGSVNDDGLLLCRTPTSEAVCPK